MAYGMVNVCKRSCEAASMLLLLDRLRREHHTVA